MERWNIEQANQWAEKHPFYFGANFTPSTAINQLEMWQKETFDPETIARELGFAEKIGMNIMRVYLHDLLWENDKEGFIKRIDQYLSIADSKGIKTMFVIFDDCWNGDFSLGPQPEPKPSTHNSGWLQSPGHAIVENPEQWPRLEHYVKELLERFKKDNRIALWDLYNEPGNGTDGDDTDDARRKNRSVPLLQAVFEWARSVEGLSQPLTVAHWHKNEEVNRCIVANSDIVSFHCYKSPEEGLQMMIDNLKLQQRPMICSEYMARGSGSTFASCLPILKRHCSGAINWGLVTGKTQTKYPWGWNAEKGIPPIWFHDIFNPDGSFLYPDEESTIMEIIK